MPIILTNGLPQGPNSLIVPNGSIGFQLNVDATVIAAPFGFVSGSFEVVFQFNAAGLIQPNSPAVAAQIYSNAELNPQNSVGLGTYYLVTFYDANGGRINKLPMWWQFPEVAGSTVDISNMTAISTVGGNVIFYPTNFGGGNGTVTSVSITGDGTIFSSTPSSPVTTTGTLTPTLLTQGANLVLAGPTTGSAAAPTFRALVTADIPATVNIWNLLANPTGNLTLATTTFNSTFTSTTGTTWKWQNLTVATSIADAPSPAIVLSGQFWDSVGTASVTKTFTVQEVNGFLKFIQGGGTSQVFPYQFDNSLQIAGTFQSPLAAFSFQTGASGTVYVVSAAGNASGGLTTYSATVTAGQQPANGQKITMAGFITHAGNNGLFIVHDSTLTTITVYSSAGVAETHAATGTLDGIYASIGQFSVIVANSTSPVFSIAGTSHPAPFQLNPFPNDPAWVATVKGDATDAAYGRIVVDGNTGNHGFELGAIIDGTGVAPVTLQIGSFNGNSSVRLGQPIAATNIANQSSNFLAIEGHYWNGAASAADVWSFQDILGAGTNPTSTLTLTHSGSSGAPTVSLGTLLLSCGTLIEATTHTPSSASDTGVTGTIAWDTGFIYICTATNTWKRVAIAGGF